MITCNHISIWNRSCAPASVTAITKKKGKKQSSDETKSPTASSSAAAVVTTAGHNLVWHSPRHTHSSLDKMLYEEKSLLRLWSMRHTIHAWPSNVKDYFVPLPFIVIHKCYVVE